ASSKDGLHYSTPKPWCWEDDTEIGNYNTQQHWLVGGGDLYLVYTRRGADNDHIFRHRAPLFIAQVDPERLRLLRATERIAVPEKGARLGNFGVTQVSDSESWVVVSEWMQTTAPNHYDYTVCEKYGANNRIWRSRILF
ncbi:MAG TPA: exo-alpha-sialidase, partial [Lentisphaeria bacterium]|nr:exo-alpha-sialidase [Lentisphaeria bacterium]